LDKAFAEADGDDARARALYIRLRAAQLEQEVLASKGQRGRRQIYGYVIILIVAVFVLLALLVMKFSGQAVFAWAGDHHHCRKAFVDIGNAPADQSNQRTDLQDYSAWEIYPVLQGPSDMMIRNNALWKR
jgi:hypothetical protein